MGLQWVETHWENDIIIMGIPCRFEWSQVIIIGLKKPMSIYAH